MEANAPDRVPPAKPGQTIGQYEIVAVIGSGGMGVVYQARDRRLGREVALKCPWPKIAEDPRQRQRFLKEARASSKLSHPNIVPVLEAFEHEGFPWIALQFVQGRNLQTVIVDQGKLPAQETLRYSEEIATALQFAHSHGVLHRDVNPRNILVTDECRALLTDFGLARSIVTPESETSTESADSVDTTRGALLGTPRYMSPEQTLGRELDPRSDIFSFGMVMYEMCTGTPAFGGDKLGELFDAIMHREPEPISRFTYEVPTELERIIRKAMAKRPDERYQDAQDLVADLRRVRRELEFEEYSGDHPPSPEPPRRTWRWVAVAASAVAVSLAGYLWWEHSRRQSVPPIGTPTRVTGAEAWEGTPVLSPDGGRVAYVSDASGNLDVYIADVHGGNQLRLTEHPASDSDPTWFPDGRALAFVSDRSGEVGIWKMGQMGGSATLILPNAWFPAISPDGKQIAFSRERESGFLRIAVAPLDNPEDATFLTGEDDGLWDHDNPAWSPDGETVCYSTRHNLWLVPAGGGAPRPLTTDGQPDTEPVFSPSGRHVYFSSDRDEIKALWRVSSKGGKAVRLTLGTGGEGHPSLSSTGRRLAYSTHRRKTNVVIRDRESGEEHVLPGVRDDSMPTIAPDEAMVVFCSDRWGPKLDLWAQPLDRGEPSGEPWRLTDHPGNASHPVFSPDGKWIAYYRILREERDIWIIPAAGGQPVRFTDDKAADVHPAWSPDGTQLVFVSDRDGGTHLWIAPVRGGKRAGEPTRVTHGEVSALAPAWSPDGKRIAFVNIRESTWEVWIVDLEDGGTLRQVTSGAHAWRLRWDSETGHLVVCGEWGSDRKACRVVDSQSGEPANFEAAIVLGGAATAPVFDLSRDGTTMVFSRDEVRGDVWVLEANESY